MIRDWLPFPFRASGMAATLPGYQLQSPWQPSPLETLDVIDRWSSGIQLFEDIYGDVPRPISRAEAMMVPAVSRSRHLITGTIAKLPLKAMRLDQKVEPQPYWCYGSDGMTGDLTAEQRTRWGIFTPQSTYQRMLDTVDDCIFYGWSLWLTTRRGADGFPSRLLHMPFQLWDVDGDGRLVDADGQPLPADRVVLIQGPHEGVLTFGSRTIRAAGELEVTAADVAKHPLRYELHQTTDVNLTREERAEIVGETRKALSTNEGIIFTNSALETKTYSMNSEDLLIGGRNAAALDVARHMNMPAAMLDAVSEGSSLEYQTTETRGRQFVQLSLTLFMDAIAARLSMDDVVPQGQHIAYDTTDLVEIAPSVTGPTLED